MGSSVLSRACAAELPPGPALSISVAPSVFGIPRRTRNDAAAWCEHELSERVQSFQKSQVDRALSMALRVHVTEHVGFE